jgi:hypothetical protein
MWGLQRTAQSSVWVVGPSRARGLQLTQLSVTWALVSPLVPSGAYSVQWGLWGPVGTVVSSGDSSVRCDL